MNQEPDGLPLQQCGRCRQFFDGDPTLHPTARPEWWACPACRVALFGQPPSPRSEAKR